MKALPSTGRFVLAASTGGHLAQLKRLAPRVGAAEDSLWVTFDTPQSRSLLSGADVLFVPYVAPRDWAGVLHARRLVEERLRADRRGFDGVVSTGAALALSAFSAGAARALPRLYIESVSRTHGPSLTGRLVRQLHLARLRTQHRSWAGGPWAYDGSVLDEYVTVPAPLDPPQSPRVFVTLGTIRPYRFDALVDAVRGTGLAGPDAVWQLGQTSRDDLPGRAFAQTSAAEFDEFCDDADVVVTHAGVGTVMQLLDRGICPVVVPRRHQRGEHVDDHQAQICELLTARGLGVVVEADELTSNHLLAAAGRRTLGVGERVAQ